MYVAGWESDMKLKAAYIMLARCNPEMARLLRTLRAHLILTTPSHTCVPYLSHSPRSFHRGSAVSPNVAPAPQLQARISTNNGLPGTTSTSSSSSTDCAISFIRCWLVEVGAFCCC